MKNIGIIIGLIIIAIGGYVLFGRPTEVNAPQNNNSNDVRTENPMAPKKIFMKTAKGTIELELYPAVAPKTVENFVKLVKEGFYNGTKFHRVIPEFMIQGGDPLSRTDDPRVGTGGPGYTFADEINPRSIGVAESVIKQYEAQGYTYDYSLTSLPVDVGSLAMANAGPNTNGSQFFIVTYQNQPHLYGKHAVFGKVTSGMDVVRKMQQGDVIQSIEIAN